jgi:hypothetical protein
VAERGCTVAEAGRWQHVSWPVTHAAFAERADPLLEQPPALIDHLGIDEHRRGRPRWRADEGTGEYVLRADRWHTCFFDLSGDQGLLGQVEGRTADDAAYWLAQCGPAWRDHIQVAAIDMYSIYASALRRMLPAARLVIDLFHVVQLAVKMTGDVRRRVTRARYGRRGRSGDAEYGIKGLLVRNLEHLSRAQFTRVMDTLGRDRHGQGILAACIAKEAALRPEPARGRHRVRSVRAGCPQPAVPLLRLVRGQRRHPRAAHPRPHHLPVGKRAGQRRANPSDERPDPRA